MRLFYKDLTIWRHRYQRPLAISAALLASSTATMGLQRKSNLQTQQAADRPLTWSHTPYQGAELEQHYRLQCQKTSDELINYVLHMKHLQGAEVARDCVDLIAQARRIHDSSKAMFNHVFALMRLADLSEPSQRPALLEQADAILKTLQVQNHTKQDLEKLYIQLGYRHQVIAKTTRPDAQTDHLHQALIHYHQAQILQQSLLPHLLICECYLDLARTQVGNQEIRTLTQAYHWCAKALEQDPQHGLGHHRSAQASLYLAALDHTHQAEHQKNAHHHILQAKAAYRDHPHTFAKEHQSYASIWYEYPQTEALASINAKISQQAKMPDESQPYELKPSP